VGIIAITFTAIAKKVEVGNNFLVDVTQIVLTRRHIYRPESNKFSFSRGSTCCESSQRSPDLTGFGVAMQQERADKERNKIDKKTRGEGIVPPLFGPQ